MVPVVTLNCPRTDWTLPLQHSSNRRSSDQQVKSVFVLSRERVTGPQTTALLESTSSSRVLVGRGGAGGVRREGGRDGGVAVPV